MKILEICYTLNLANFVKFLEIFKNNYIKKSKK